jgi:hypothetical protein
VIGIGAELGEVLEDPVEEPVGVEERELETEEMVVLEVPDADLEARAT